MHDASTRHLALALLEQGLTLSQASRETGVSRSTLRAWRSDPRATERGTGCHLCASVPLDAPAYAALLGYYLGDGCLSRAQRYWALRVSCDAKLPGIIDDVARLITAVRPTGRVFRIRAPGVVVVQSHWQHWTCLFPQHGPGRKHQRPIVLEDWQRAIVEEQPGPFLRGLFHSDGCRARNWARRTVAGVPKRYDYPRWQFTNVSTDIRELCCWALDMAEVPWRQSNATTISVSRREAVARLDELIGPKR
ncbi:hypothetical protein GCM10009623_02730 [Nocardioides aestuarii]|uniref:Helix-turn-helix domain-containing protein n=1 Tax=Nocardioides aestuarii TaxID=252231 RepID=A0ABW4TJH0_9ACTN